MVRGKWRCTTVTTGNGLSVRRVVMLWGSDCQEIKAAGYGMAAVAGGGHVRLA